MSFLVNSLGPGEVVVHRATVHWVALFWPSLAVLALAALWAFFSSAVAHWIIALPLICALAWLGEALLRKWTTELGVTTRKVVAKWGLVARRSIEQRLEKVDSIEVDQTFTGRILNYGSITVHGSGLTAAPIRNIADPISFRRKVEDALHSKLELLAHADQAASQAESQPGAAQQ